MPSAANSPAPANAPAMRAVSLVVREMPMPRNSNPGGMVSATSAWRIAISDGRTSPHSATTTNTATGVSSPMNASVIRVAASVA